MKFNDIINKSACAMAGFHLVVCGGPMIAAILGVASPLAGIISPRSMIILLAVAGLALAASWINYIRGCKCNKKILFLSTALFTLAMGFHFVLPLFAAPATGGEFACH